MPAEPYIGTQAEHSSDPPACSRACREVSHSKKKREKMLHPNLRGAEQANWAHSVGNSTVENFCILLLIIIKYVCIEYDGKAYPGFVEDADLAQVYGSCMHSVGKEMLNCFFWPFFFSLPDLNWYDHDQILAVILKQLFYNMLLWSWS